MKPQTILKNYFTGRAELNIKYANTSNVWGRENLAFWQQVQERLDSYVDKQPKEIVDMQKEHFRNGVPYMDVYNVVAPTKTINKVNSELTGIAKSIYQPERIKELKLYDPN